MTWNLKLLMLFVSLKIHFHGNRLWRCSSGKGAGKQPEAVAGSSVIAQCCGHPLHTAESCWVHLVLLPWCIQGGRAEGWVWSFSPAVLLSPMTSPSNLSAAPWFHVPPPDPQRCRSTGFGFGAGEAVCSMAAFLWSRQKMPLGDGRGGHAW